MPKRKRQSAKSKHWVLTLNNPTKRDSETVKRPGTEGSLLDYLILGKEKGEDGTKHLQGYCVFKNRVRLSGVKKIWPRAHLEIRKGTPKEAMDYCKKEGTWREWGVIPVTQGQREKADWDVYYNAAKEGRIEDIPRSYLVRYYAAFKRIKQDNPIVPEDLKEKKNYWVLAPSQYGKSKYARDRWPDHFDKAPNKWFIGYKDQTTLLLDDFGPHQCQFLGWYMKRWADHYSFPMETKGGGHQIRPKHVVVTSQYSIQQCFPDPLECDAIANRFKVIELLHWKDRINM